MRACKESLKELSNVNSLRICGVPGHVGNEIADELARKGSANPGGASLNLLGKSVKPQISELKIQIDKEIRLKWNTIWKNC